MNVTLLTNQVAAEQIFLALSRRRDEYLQTHQRIAIAHPNWVTQNDARTNLLGKPINMLLIAMVNVRLNQTILDDVGFWSSCLSPDLQTPDQIAPTLFEQNVFYRFGFFIFLMSNIEHGFRAIQPKVIHGLDAQSEKPFYDVYKTLFQATLSTGEAQRYIELYDFLRTLRNTIHNNAVYSPVNGKSATYSVHGRVYSFSVGKRVDLFSWDNMCDWLGPIRESLESILTSPKVEAIGHISDIACHP